MEKKVVTYFHVTCVRLDKDLKFQNTEFNSVLNYDSLIKDFKSKDKGFNFKILYLEDNIMKMNLLNTQSFQIEDDKHYWFYYVCRVR